MIPDKSLFRRTIIRQVIIILFWITGLSTCMAITVSVRQFQLLFGNTIYITIAVMCTVLIGISCGSYFGGRWIDRKRNELRAFFWIELIIGAYLLMLFVIFKLLPSVAEFIFHHYKSYDWKMLGVQGFFIFSSLIAPMVLIGGLFPILGRFLIQASDRARREIGNLYGVYAFGVAIGFLIMLLVLFPVIGIERSLLFAAMLFLLCAGIIKFFLSQIDPTIYIETEFYNQQLKHLAQVHSPRSPFLKHTMKIGIAIFGILSSSYLILWLKPLTFVAGDNSIAIYVSLAVFFGGLTLGALLYPRFLERNNLYMVFGLIQIIIGSFAILSIFLLAQLPTINEQLFKSLIAPQRWIGLLLMLMYDATLVLLVPAMVMGVTLPLIFKLYLTSYEHRGKSLGTIFSANTLGHAIGLIVTPILLVYYAGTQKSLTFVSILNLLIGLAVLLLASIRYGKLLRTTVAIGIVTSFLLLTLFLPSNVMVRLIESQLPGESVDYLKESAQLTVAIAHERSPQHRSLILNGVKIAETNKESATIQMLCGHLPLLLHHRPESVLVIGYRDGETIASILNHQVRQVDCLEHRSEIPATAALIHGDRYGLNRLPNLTVIPLEARYYFAHAKKKYDVIINDIVHPAFDANGRLFTVEYFQAGRKMLNAAGIMCSVIPIFKMSIEDFKGMLATFRAVFQSTLLWYPNNYLSSYAILIGSTDASFKINYKSITQGMQQPEIMIHLATIGLDNSYEILDSFVFGNKIAGELTEGVRIHRDATPYLEFSCPKISDTRQNRAQILQLMANYREPVYPHLTNIEATSESKEMVRLILDNYYKSTELVLRASGFELIGDTTTALNLYRRAYALNRFDRASKRFFDAYFDPMLLDSAHTPAEYVQNATVLYQKMEYEESISQLLKALELNPNYAPAYFALGINYEAMGEVRKARDMYLKTLRLKPNLQQAKSRLDSLVIGN